MAPGNPTQTGASNPAAPPRRRPGRPVGSTAGRSVRREEYLDGIIEAIRRIGPEATLAELAAGAGMSKPVLYDHFTDRLGLTAAVVGKLTVTVAADAMLAALSGGQPEELIAKVFDVFVAFVEREPQIYGWVLRAAGDLPAGGLSELPMATEAGAQLSMLIGSVLRAAGVDSGGAEPWAFGTVGFVLAATDWWLNRRSMSRTDFVNYLAKFVWGGLQSSGVQKIDMVAVLAAVPAMVDASRAVMETIERPAGGGEGRDA